jgi:hypothetical protein
VDGRQGDEGLEEIFGGGGIMVEDMRSRREIGYETGGDLSERDRPRGLVKWKGRALFGDGVSLP